MTRPPPRWSDRDIADARYIKARMDEVRRHVREGTGGGWSEWSEAIPAAISAREGIGDGDFIRIVREKWDAVPSAYDSLDAMIDFVAFVNSVLDLPPEDIS